MDLLHNGINNTNPTSLNSPGQMAIDLSETATAQHLYVVDTQNSRILGWNDATSFTNGQPADLVIGQPDFDSTACNSGGVGASSLCLPGGVAVDSDGNLYVGDTLNNRVLVSVRRSTSQRVSAFRRFRVGRNGSFTTSSCADYAVGLCTPQGVAVEPAHRPSIHRRRGQ